MFRCALTDLEAIDYEVGREGSSTISVLPIGTDKESGSRYSLLAAFDSVPGYAGDRQELVFCLVEADREGHVYQIWDSLDVKRRIPLADDRRAILGALHQMVGAMIDYRKPKVVTMIAHEANLPRSAMRRYHVVAEAFRQNGYRAGTSDPYHGRQTWMMERMP